jgi:hypothetical protein
MKFSADPKQDDKPDSDLKRFETPIGLLAIALYVIERLLAFAFLQDRAGSGTGLESQLLGFFFGQPPYSILDILFGFDIPESLIGIFNPRNIIQAILQAVHFLINWWLAGLPFRLYLLLEKRNSEPSSFF